MYLYVVQNATLKSRAVMTLTLHFPHLRHAISRPTRSVIGANLILPSSGTNRNKAHNSYSLVSVEDQFLFFGCYRKQDRYL